MGKVLASGLTETLRFVAGVMSCANEPWWIIASAAAALHGIETDVRDVDVLLAQNDAAVVLRQLSIEPMYKPPHPLFRSTSFAIWRETPLDVEFMSGFAVRRPFGWHEVAPRTRLAISLGDATIFIPGSEELADMLEAFGREKDFVRASQLRAVRR